MFDSVEAPLKSIPESEWVVVGGKVGKESLDMCGRRLKMDWRS